MSKETGLTQQPTTHAATRYRVMVMRDGRPAVIAQPLTAGQAATFVRGYASKGFYIEKMPDHIRPGAMAH